MRGLDSIQRITSCVLSRTSLELPPTATPNVPRTTTQPCDPTLHVEKDRGESSSVTNSEAPAARVTFPVDTPSL